MLRPDIKRHLCLTLGVPSILYLCRCFWNERDWCHTYAVNLLGCTNLPKMCEEQVSLKVDLSPFLVLESAGPVHQRERERERERARESCSHTSEVISKSKSETRDLPWQEADKVVEELDREEPQDAKHKGAKDKCPHDDEQPSNELVAQQLTKVQFLNKRWIGTTL